MSIPNVDYCHKKIKLRSFGFILILYISKRQNLYLMKWKYQYGFSLLFYSKEEYSIAWARFSFNYNSMHLLKQHFKMQK